MNLRHSMNLRQMPEKVQIPLSIRMLEIFGVDIGKCPKCEKGRLKLIASYRSGVLVKSYENNASSKMVRNKDLTYSKTLKP